MTETEQRSSESRFSRIHEWLILPIDIASLVAFRVLFGILMASAMIRFLAKGWVAELYLLPKFHFPYDGLGWIRPWPAEWMQVHFIALGVLALMVAVGFFYRIAIVLFWLGFTYVEMIDQTAYLNHYYLVSLLSFLLIFMPAHRRWSFDSWLRPGLRLDRVPYWTIQLLRFQIAVVYIYAGLAKVNTDWLWHAEPLRIWLAARSELPIVGHWLQSAGVAYVASWFGAFYDLSIVFFLANRRTRPLAFFTVIAFHLATGLLFNIGMFPWIMIVATTVFFHPDWPRRFLKRWTEERSADGSSTRMPNDFRDPRTSLLRFDSRLLVPSVMVYTAIQVLVPLRPYLLGEGHPAWSYRGFNWAWQVMVAEKNGYVEFYARDLIAGERTPIRTRDYLTPRQELLMCQDPFLIQLFARKLSTDLRNQGRGQTQIVVDAFATINGRPSQRMINPDVDLATAPGVDWLLPLEATVGSSDHAARCR